MGYLDRLGYRDGTWIEDAGSGRDVSDVMSEMLDGTVRKALRLDLIKPILEDTSGYFSLVIYVDSVLWNMFRPIGAEIKGLIRQHHDWIGDEDL